MLKESYRYRRLEDFRQRFALPEDVQHKNCSTRCHQKIYVYITMMIHNDKSESVSVYVCVCEREQNDISLSS